MFKRSRKTLLFLSMFLMLFSVIAPTLDAAAAGDPADLADPAGVSAYAGDNGNSGAGQPEQSKPPSFSDIKTHWAYNEIMELAAANIVAGFEDGTFKPSGKVTREQFLKMLVELRKLPHASADVPFKDVDPKRWSAPYIAAGLSNGILLLADFPDGFKPSQPITRYEMAVWIVRALQLPPQTEENLLGQLKDQASLKLNRDLIEAALQSGIIQGYPDGNFKGGNNSTRAEAAVMLVRALHYSPGQQPASTPGGSRKIVEYKPEVKQSKSTDYSKRDAVTWVIKDPNLKLNVGDVFVLPPNDKYYGGVAKKVVSLSKENGALVVKTSVPKPREVFSKLDISTTEAINPKMLKPIDSSVTIKANEVAAQSTSVTLPCMNIGMNHAYVQGVTLDANMNFCNLGVKADIGLDIDIDWFDIDLDFYSSLVLIGDVTTNVHVVADTGNGALNEPKMIPLTTPFYVPVFTGVFVKGQLFLRIDPDFRATIVVDFNDKFHLEEGFSLSSGNGLHQINNTTNTAALNVDTKANASLAAGPDVQLTLTLLDIAYAGIDLYPGIKAGYYRNYEQGRCDAIAVDAFLRLDVIAGYDVWVASDDFRKNVVDANYRLFQYDLNCPPPKPPGNLKFQLSGVRGTAGKYNEVIINRTDVQLSWDAVGDAASYTVKRSESPGGPFAVRRANLADTKYKDTTAAIGKTYYYQVTAVNENGESIPSNTIKVAVTMQPPPAPQNLTAVRGESGVVLKWDDVGGLVGYDVQRADGTGTDFKTIAANVSGTTYTDPSTSFIRGFSYRVTAGDRGGISAPSNVVYVPKENIDIIDTVPIHLPDVGQIVLLPVPGNFDATTNVGSGKVVLSWTAVKGATGYKVMRSTADNGNFETLNAKVSGTTFTDTTAAIGARYYYKVSAVNDSGAESKATAVKSAVPGYGIR
ncbi:hypothetical protein GZH47_25710 [Paenibacillus rhizovicinus]|uniref:S-layer homology domain-containing protein n=1 Tax=Paenibacillus rhizovicinus TaxID=2704463 RepID=A0A6C0P5R1_9BACL|nr:S-layer homology domain-containing protein [Paenibacillus rhizovicinus]QHW33858.1 hypothetical protein GZH47_25710 [Paenibacillus rhizovicinus]